MYAIGHDIATYLFGASFVVISMAGGQRGGKLPLKSPPILYGICFDRDLSSEHFKAVVRFSIFHAYHVKLTSSS